MLINFSHLKIAIEFYQFFFLSLDEHKSDVFGSIIDGIFEGNINTETNGTYFVEKAYKYFPRHLVNETNHSVMYHENDIIDPFADRRQGNNIINNIRQIEF